MRNWWNRLKWTFKVSKEKISFKASVKDDGFLAQVLEKLTGKKYNQKRGGEL